MDGEVVSEQPVAEGGSAEAPDQAPYINDGTSHRRFSGWTGEYTDVHSDITVTAFYGSEGHTWSDGAVTLEPTCAETGLQARSCACGAANEKILAVDPDNHADYGTKTAGEGKTEDAWFEGGKGDWFYSVTTLSAPLNGTTAYDAGDSSPKVSKTGATTTFFYAVTPSPLLATAST